MYPAAPLVKGCVELFRYTGILWCSSPLPVGWPVHRQEESKAGAAPRRGDRLLRESAATGS